MSSFELGRYLDYCVEMLSLLGKIAAVYVQRFDDEVALEAASEVEMLINGLVVRIWQKTMFAERFGIANCPKSRERCTQSDNSSELKGESRPLTPHSRLCLADDF